jgi:hypothetical protein
LHNGGEMKLVARTGKSPEPHPLDAGHSEPELQKTAVPL